ncbi:l-allo-threonine aldolase [Hypoxylon rubiginosum]|uniref:L-allo-threonine aldolase n=1 Tax=Hypoxylon rubiginosum TaxID=110542 RepID=A0ACB9YP20_9PEZI|nr:l-allo-threonine aldolase [Hypoxylon rubiginosum]
MNDVSYASRKPGTMPLHLPTYNQHEPAILIQLRPWGNSGSSAYDFRSDRFTTPDAAMLQSIIRTSLLDDETMGDPTTNSFQTWMAELTGHEETLLVISGTMGNQVALRTALAPPPYSILCDRRSRIARMEAGGAASLCGARINGIWPSNGHHLTLDDVKKHITHQEAVHNCPTRVISLENTLCGTIIPLEDVRAISAFARAQKPPVHMHLDGARLWEAVSAGAGGLQEYARCFDSVSLCFTKGLGAPLGAVVAGSAAFVGRARAAREVLGGGVRRAGVVAAPAWVAVEHNFLRGRLYTVMKTARRISDLWVGMGGRLRHPTETNVIWLDLEAAGVSGDEFAGMAERAGLKTSRGRLQGRLVVHYQICDEAVESLVIGQVEEITSSRS